MGDSASTLSGALGALIVFRLITQHHLVSNWYTIVMTALVASVTVCGKAMGKGIALQESSEIMFQIGRIVAWVERLTGREFFVTVNQKKKKK
jgi:uncharacterized membrane protein YjfL (UPF0719 family)